ncbi:MAG: transcriptional repressor [bacterium]|nr:transcriptional repressor [bacterium]
MPERNLKELLLELLKQHHLITVSDMLQLLKKQGHGFNKTSVYRALEQLLTDNTVCRHYFADAQAQYELQDDHTHLVCESCGKVELAECTFTQPAKVKNFTVDHHHVTLVGHCGACSSKN